jgi:hypothetical protein
MTATREDGSPVEPSVVVEVLPAAAIDEMVGKVRAAAAAAGTAEAVAAWRAAHGDELWRAQAHDHAVVGETLMYLHDAPDGMLVPHARYPDGTEKVYTDPDHADVAYPRT